MIDQVTANTLFILLLSFLFISNMVMGVAYLNSIVRKIDRLELKLAELAQEVNFMRSR